MKHMNKNITILLSLSVLLAGCTTFSVTNDTNEAPDEAIVSQDESNVISEEVDAIEFALGNALDDEYKARTMYEQVLEEYGDVRPFYNIINAEENHVTALLALYEQYGYVVPENPYQDVNLLEGYSSIQELCAAGVQAEIDNAALYREQLIPSVADNADVVTTFTRLMSASENNHLPAFQRCD